ncbi:MAG: hypothetical protein QXS32_07665 [Candidatus Nezhaarchaeales archaeon]
MVTHTDTDTIPPVEGGASGVGEAFPTSDPSLLRAREILREYGEKLQKKYETTKFENVIIYRGKLGEVKINTSAVSDQLFFFITVNVNDNCHILLSSIVDFRLHKVYVDVSLREIRPFSLFEGSYNIDGEPFLQLLKTIALYGISDIRDFMTLFASSFEEEGSGAYPIVDNVLQIVMALGGS